MQESDQVAQALTNSPTDRAQMNEARLGSVRQDRGAEKRLELEKRGPLVNANELQENVHLEMHTRGG